MYNESTLYYLNQLGISPWIYKEPTKNPLKLLVFSLKNQSDKAQILLKRMMNFVTLEEYELLIIHIDLQKHEIAHLIKHHAVLKNAVPAAILTLGVDATKMAQELNWHCPILSNGALDHLLRNPSEKRKVFNDLLYACTLYGT